MFVSSRDRTRATYEHTNFSFSRHRLPRRAVRVRPNEIQPRQGAVANAGSNSVASTGAETIAGANSVKTDGYPGADSGQTDAHTRASSRRQSLSRPPGRELQRQKIPFHSEREGSGA